MARIAHACSSETGTLYGKPGDQTGREVRIDTLGADGNQWVYIFRCKNAARTNIGVAAQQIAENNNVGYSQERSGDVYSSRWGLRQWFLDTHRVDNIGRPVNCDCSEMVAVNCMVAGAVGGTILSRDFVTCVEWNLLNATGQFERIPYDINIVKKGDILWREGHTATVIEGNVPEGDNTPTVKKYSQTPQYVGEVYNCNILNVRTGPGTNYAIFANYPALGPGNLIDVCDSEGDWKYIRIAGKYFAWVSATYIKRPATTTEKSTNNAVVKTGVVSTQLYIRKSPNALAATVTICLDDGRGKRNTLCQNEVVTIIGESNGWYQIQIGDQTPWCSAKYVAVTSAVSNREVTKIGTVITELNVRSGPSSLNGKVKFNRCDGRGDRTTLKEGETVTIIGASGKWLNVKLTDSVNGWVSGDYIRQ